MTNFILRILHLNLILSYLKLHEMAAGYSGAVVEALNV